MTLRGSTVGWSLLALVLTACAGRQAATGAASAEVIHQARKGEEKETRYDLNQDGKPDVWSFTVPAPATDKPQRERLVRKELDLNGDGLIDIRRVYDEQEALARESLDLDFDGRVDQTNHYEKGAIVRKERDLDYNGKVDEWVFYASGKIARKERDANGDTRVDYWEYWENDAVDRVGEDVDGDGKVDRWSKSGDPQTP